MERILIDALSLAPSMAQAVLDTLQQHLKNHPADIERLAPGSHLIPRPAKVAQRDPSNVSAANAGRLKQLSESSAAVEAMIRGIQDDYPAISFAGIAEELNRVDVPMPRGGYWTARSVRRLMRKTK